MLEKFFNEDLILVLWERFIKNCTKVQTFIEKLSDDKRRLLRKDFIRYGLDLKYLKKKE